MAVGLHVCARGCYLSLWPHLILYGLRVFLRCGVNLLAVVRFGACACMLPPVCVSLMFPIGLDSRFHCELSLRMPGRPRWASAARSAPLQPPSSAWKASAGVQHKNSRPMAGKQLPRLNSLRKWLPNPKSSFGSSPGSGNIRVWGFGEEN